MRKNRVILEKMLRYARKAVSFCKDCDLETFISNEEKQHAVAHVCIQLGELARALDGAYAQEHPQIPLHQIRGLRNRLVHDYENVNPVILWKIMRGDFPVLIEEFDLLVATPDTENS